MRCIIHIKYRGTRIQADSMKLVAIGTGQS